MINTARPNGMSKCALRCSLLTLFFWNFLALAQPSSFAQPKVRKSPIIPGRYTLVLKDPAVADRFTTRDALATAQADTYRRQVEAAQAQVKSDLTSRGFRVLGSVSVLGNAIFVAAPPSRAAELQSIPGVIAVRASRRMKLLLNRATTLSNAPAAWTAVGGQSNAGAGIKIGVIDSGIDQTHPALQDNSLSMPSGFPKGVTAYTTNKVIVARSYVSLEAAGSNPSNPAVDSLPDDLSPRDRIGHGTLNAVIAAGNLGVATPAIATTGGAVVISGMAPKAWLGNYKVGGSPGVDEFASDQALMKAVDDAVSDGMDVITCSIGGDAYSDWASDPVAAEFQKATQFAVVVAAAGDSGTASIDFGYQYPGFNTISSPSNAPDVISVGATLNSHVFQSTVTVNAAGVPSSLVGISGAYGDSFPYPSNFGANTAPLVDITTLGDNGLACSPLAANSIMNAPPVGAPKYALILRGTCSFDTKAANVQAAGAIGFIYYMADSTTPINPEGIMESGPSIMVSNASGLALKSYVDANPGTMVTIDLNGAEQELATYSTFWGFTPALAANQFASYSLSGPYARRPVETRHGGHGRLDFELTPDGDLPAPYGMYSATQNYDPNLPFDINVFSTNRYAAANGTSLSTPLVAGTAALLKQAHSSLRPTQIKSLLVNYAGAGCTRDDFGDPVDAEWIGARATGCRRCRGCECHCRAFHHFVRNSELRHAANHQDHHPDQHFSSSMTFNASVSCCSVNGFAGRSRRYQPARKPEQRDPGRGSDRHLNRDRLPAPSRPWASTRATLCSRTPAPR